jgi:hypothetical protein
MMALQAPDWRAKFADFRASPHEFAVVGDEAVALVYAWEIPGARVIDETRSLK